MMLRSAHFSKTTRILSHLFLTATSIAGVFRNGLDLLLTRHVPVIWCSSSLQLAYTVEFTTSE